MLRWSEDSTVTPRESRSLADKTLHTVKQRKTPEKARKGKGSGFVRADREDARLLGGNIRVTMARRGMTQQDLAKASGTPQPTISRYITGKTPPSPERLVKIAEALDTTPEALMQGDGIVEGKEMTYADLRHMTRLLQGDLTLEQCRELIHILSARSES